MIGGHVLTGKAADNIQDFVTYAQSLRGDEKGEAQVLCDRLFRAFGHEGYKEAGATLEYRVRKKERGTKFADLLWRRLPPRETPPKEDASVREVPNIFPCLLHQ
jgi:hypothetical protein